ncbi:MAG: hypothetical protein Kow0025_13790 [Thermodesulfovibrionales bacterium]
MKGPAAVLALVLLAALALAPAALGAGADPDGEGWSLINDSGRGDLLFVHSPTMERPAQGVVRVWMKFVTRAESSPSPMLFLDEVDCAKGLVRRLEARMYRSTPAGSGEPFRSLSFEGGWDRPSEGVEERLVEAVCGEETSGRGPGGL